MSSSESYLEAALRFVEEHKGSDDTILPSGILYARRDARVINVLARLEARMSRLG